MGRASRKRRPSYWKCAQCGAVSSSQGPPGECGDKACLSPSFEKVLGIGYAPGRLLSCSDRRYVVQKDGSIRRA